MDLQPTPFPGKSRHVKSRINQKNAPDSRNQDPKTLMIASRSRVFGTSRTNLLVKPGTEKPLKKQTAWRNLEKQPESRRKNPNPSSEGSKNIRSENARRNKLQNPSVENLKAIASSNNFTENIRNVSSKTEKTSKASLVEEANLLVPESENAKERTPDRSIIEHPKVEEVDETGLTVTDRSLEGSEGVDLKRSEDEIADVVVSIRTSDKPIEKSVLGNARNKMSHSMLKPTRKKSSEETKLKLKKMSGVFHHKVAENCIKTLNMEADSAFLHTPPQPSMRKPRSSLDTPFHSAKQCGKCRFDRLETSSYWLTQIKLAETGGKHNVSAAFFRLALECESKPIRDIRVELKRYLGRHEHLAVDDQWQDVCISYGLLKHENKGVEIAASDPDIPSPSKASGDELDEDEELEQ